VIWRVRYRHEFEQLQRDGIRIRPEVGDPVVKSSLWSRVIVDSDDVAPRLAFAIGRAVGPAVVRNRLRRRLRAAFAAAFNDGVIPPGRYLIGAQPSAVELTFDDLTRAVRSIGEQARRRGARR
jgi:ribonuclease P protein component